MKTAKRNLTESPQPPSPVVSPAEFDELAAKVADLEKRAAIEEAAGRRGAAHKLREQASAFRCKACGLDHEKESLAWRNHVSKVSYIGLNEMVLEALDEIGVASLNPSQRRQWIERLVEEGVLAVLHARFHEQVTQFSAFKLTASYEAGESSRRVQGYRERRDTKQSIEFELARATRNA